MFKIVLVGCPNVGKSTLFNRLLKKKIALTSEVAGTTRDRREGEYLFSGHAFQIFDTGGVTLFSETELGNKISNKSLLTCKDADCLVWVLDGRIGLTTEELNIVKKIRTIGKPTILAINKMEGIDAGASPFYNEFYRLGFKHTLPLSAKRGSGIPVLQSCILEVCLEQDAGDQIAVSQLASEHATEQHPLSIAVVGRPNVGKSTLVNMLLTEAKQITDDLPGTTRDAIAFDWNCKDTDFRLIDSAGIRRKNRIQSSWEKDAIGQSLYALKDAEIVLVVLDASEGLTSQDRTLTHLVAQQGKGSIVVLNKWDLISPVSQERLIRHLNTKFTGFDYMEVVKLSALHGNGKMGLIKSIKRISQTLQQDFSTARISCILQDALIQRSPPIKNHRKKPHLRYAHLGGRNPFRIVIHGSNLEQIPDQYCRYLARFFRTELQIKGIPLLINLKGRRDRHNATS